MYCDLRILKKRRWRLGGDSVEIRVEDQDGNRFWKVVPGPVFRRRVRLFQIDKTDAKSVLPELWRGSAGSGEEQEL